MNIRCERVYDYLRRERGRDEVVVLIDRIWPRGVRREHLDYDEWVRDLAPTGELRRWFAHDPDRWRGFKARYLYELRHSPQDRLRFRNLGSGKTLTLLYSARDEEHNQAVVFKYWLEKDGDETVD